MGVQPKPRDVSNPNPNPSTKSYPAFGKPILRVHICSQTPQEFTVSHSSSCFCSTFCLLAFNVPNICNKLVSWLLCLAGDELLLLWLSHFLVLFISYAADMFCLGNLRFVLCFNVKGICLRGEMGETKVTRFQPVLPSLDTALIYSALSVIQVRLVYQGGRSRLVISLITFGPNQRYNVE